ncbi:MAG TPA: CehA/McbA family metallohydrolase, partial [Bryobacteraceae bacterium]|nr:CehA/McbA family metallohydrolase [Bryobacteraceae bacterium]
NADSHVHFLAPSTALLEGQAEGLNLINLLAAQWGDLFTNVADLRHGSLTAPDGEMMVRLGTENRNHLLGHLGLLGSNNPPVFPMSAAGPGESYLGDPLWTSLSEWADRCRERDGLVMAVHFPYPTGELAADIVLGKIDAVEVRPNMPTEHFNGLRFLDWYHYLNCGYRLPIFGGTDKMSASMCAGSLRGYAFLGQDEFTFANWAKAVRRGNTFMTSGPLLLFEADGHAPGSDIQVRAGGAGVEVRAEATSAIPIHKLEIVWNGKVVAAREEQAGARELLLRDTVRVQGPGWLAARCVSRLPAAERRIAAHTSPVYVVVPGEDLFSAPAAAYMLTLIEGSELWTRHLATRPDQARLARTLDVFTTARDRLHQRFHQHGIDPPVRS